MDYRQAAPVTNALKSSLTAHRSHKPVLKEDLK